MRQCSYVPFTDNHPVYTERMRIVNKSAIKEVVAAVRRAVEDDLRAKGELPRGTKVQIKAHITNPDKTTRTISLDAGVGTFNLAGVNYVDRKLTDEEKETLKNAPCWEQAYTRWLKDFVERLLDEGNRPIPESRLVSLSIECGRRHRLKRKTYADSLVGTINDKLREVNLPFRIVCSAKRRKWRRDQNMGEKEYRFYAVAD